MTINAKTEKWIRYTQGRSDRQRAIDTASKIRRQIGLWEKIRVCSRWTEITELLDDDTPSNGERRRVALRYARRFLMVCAEAGLIELHHEHPYASIFRRVETKTADPQARRSTKE